jgi:uncharacterized protein YjbI with pentapeptide repeats
MCYNAAVAAVNTAVVPLGLGLVDWLALLCNVDFQNVDFQNVNFQNVDFQNVDFQNADFKNVDFQNVKKRDCGLFDPSWYMYY